MQRDTPEVGVGVMHLRERGDAVDTYSIDVDAEIRRAIAPIPEECRNGGLGVVDAAELKFRVGTPLGVFDDIGIKSDTDCEGRVLHRCGRLRTWIRFGPSVVGTDGSAAIAAAALRGFLGRPKTRATTLVVPTGMIPSAAAVPTAPLAAWWTTPSPPMAATTAYPSVAARDASSRVSPGPCGHSASTSNESESTEDTSRCSAPVNPEAEGLARRSSRRIG